MHAVLVTFRSSASPDALRGPFGDYANALKDQPGLVMKTWLADGETLGGFLLFADRGAADAYLQGPMLGAVKGNPAFTDWEVHHFDVLDDLSGVTGTPRAALAAAPA